MNAPFLRTPYNYDRNEASDDSGLSCPEETRTQQNFKEECDINTLVRRFKITGLMPQNVRPPQYQDFDGVTDYHTAMNAVRQAAESFAQMPANVRKRFDNDAGNFTTFCMNPENKEEMKKLGLLIPEAFQKPLDLQPKDAPAPLPDASKDTPK